MPEVPYASRPFGWCQSDDHAKCDGLIDHPMNPYRCPCACHKPKKRRVVRGTP